MKALGIFIIVLTLTSCDEQRRYNERLEFEHKLNMKIKELEYIKKLYDVRGDILHEEKMRVLDSLIEASNKIKYGL